MASEYLAADLIVDTLIESGVDVAFGVPGKGLDGILKALESRSNQIRFVVAMQEQAAAFMACAYAKWTGRLGCCLASHSAGGVNLLSGLYDAAHESAPVIAVTGQPDSRNTRRALDAEIDLLRLFRNVAVHSAGVVAVDHAHTAVMLACHIADVRRGVAHVSVPATVQAQPADHARTRARVAAPGPEPRTRLVPTARDVEAGAEILHQAKRVAILAGQGVAGAVPELLRLAERLGAPIATAHLGKAVVPGDHPNVVGSIGVVGTHAAELAFDECDALLIVGSSCPWVESYPPASQVRTVQIDIDPTRIGLRFPVDAGIVGDAAEALRALTPLLPEKTGREFLTRVQSRKQSWLQSLEEPADAADTALPLLHVIRELDARLSPDAVITTDCGPHTALAAQFVHVRREQQLSTAGALGATGGGLPYAIAAAVAYPNRQVVAIVTDESLAASAAELATCARYALPVKVVVLNDGSARTRWESVATGFGVRAFTATDTAGVNEGLDAAFRHDGPALVDAVVQAPKVDQEDTHHGTHQTDRHRQPPDDRSVRLLA
jgi:thiamine pyrophosphate-dependent acetolactate synthase large subunit-like protein